MPIKIDLKVELILLIDQRYRKKNIYNAYYCQLLKLKYNFF